MATDGHRLTLIKKGISTDESTEWDMIIPAKTVGFISKMLEGSEKDIKISLSKGTCRFVIGDYTLTSKIITEKYPNYDQVIPKDNTKALIADRSILMAVTKRAAVLSNPVTHLLKFNLSEGKLEIFSSNYDVSGEGYERIDVDYSEEPMNIGFNSTYLIEILNHIESDEVKILMKNSLSASLILPLPQVEGEEYLSILMPLRLPEEET